MLEIVRYCWFLGDALALLWFFILASFLVLFWKRKWLAGLVCLIIAWFLFLMATEIPVWLVSSLEKPYARTSWNTVPASDAVVVLGGGNKPSQYDVFGFDLNAAADRFLTALELMRQGKGRVLVLGGGAYTMNGKRLTYSGLLRNWLEAWHMPGKPVFDLGFSMNTYEEALAFERLAKEQGWRSVILVTSATHMRRSEAVFRNVGFAATCVACDFQVFGRNVHTESLRWIPRKSRLDLFNLYLHEIIGEEIYRWRGWMVDRSRPGGA
jgi:uncharacterized SAM-binding protein YcdF (DUF218 family)